MTEPTLLDDVYDDSLEINLRATDQIGQSMLVLTTRARRILIDYEFQNSDRNDAAEEERASTAFDLRNWSEEQGFVDFSNPNEAESLSAVFTEVDDALLMVASAGLESVAILCWACGLVDQSWDEISDSTIARVLELVPEPWEDVGDFISSLQLRELHQIATERERAEIWKWRSQLEPERRAAKGADRRAIGEMIAEALVEGMDIGLLPEKDVNDFIWQGKPVRGLTVTENEELEITAETGLVALNWVCGYGETLDDTPLLI